MGRRIEVELTSRRDDGTWTWRAAGARQPKGVLDGSLLFEGAKVGDVVRADAEFDIDGITVTAVLPPRETRAEPDRLEMKGSGQELEPVTTSLVGKRGRERRRERGDRRPRDGEGRERRGRRERRATGPGDGAERPRGDERGRGARGPRREKPPVEKKPKPPRLRPKRTHRDAVLATLPDEQRPIAEQLLRGGIPAVRQAIEKQNEEARAAGQPEVKADAIVALAEELLPPLREAEWRDRADAALAGIDEVDLRDIRSVVVAADAAARSPEARELAEAVRAGLAARVERDQAAWLKELADTLAEGRVVRALRLSSRPPKAGAPLPPDLAVRLAEAAGAALTAEVSNERYATVLDALAYSPVRAQAQPAGVPEKPSDELLGALQKLASRVPQVAERFGISPTAAPARPRGAAAIPAPPPNPAPSAKGDAGDPPPATDEAAPSTPSTDQAASPEPPASSADQATTAEPSAPEGSSEVS